MKQLSRQDSLRIKSYLQVKTNPKRNMTNYYCTSSAT